MDYARAQALAQRLIAKNGKAITFQRLDATPADPEKPWKGPGEPIVAATHDTVAVSLPHASLVDLGFHAVDDELLKRTEQVLLVPGGAVDLEPFTNTLEAGVRWRIEWVRTLRPATVTVLYAFGVKR
jgi:hypothetical protein